MARTIDDILSAPDKADEADEALGITKFRPEQPLSLEQTELNPLLLEDLICKVLLQRGTLSGKELSEIVCLPLKIFEELLYELKQQMTLAYQATSGVDDFVYGLTEKGRQKALMAREISAYTGPAPVLYEEYVDSVRKQSIGNEQPGRVEVEKAFAGLVLPERFFSQVGPAINSGRGVFLYGDPGNGKTEVATRVARCFADTVYIPKTLLIEGHLVRLYDPQCHTVADDTADGGEPPYDRRWLRIERPAVVVGGEMDMDSMEIGYNPQTRVCEASLQMKGNCGVFVIDDFGRQRVRPEQILNRWILPLEKRIDYLTLPTGNKFQVPFNALLIFCTNLEPAHLMDEAFLRRLPYKIRMEDPSEEGFLAILHQAAAQHKIEYSPEMAEYLLDGHFRNKRPLRGCYPRDIMQQLVNIALYEQREPVMTRDDLDKAAGLYLGLMKKTERPGQNE